MVVQVGSPRELGSDRPRFRFGLEAAPRETWSGPRLLLLDERPAFELSFPCGTCGFLFRRLDGAGAPLVDALRERLTEGLSGIDDQIVASFGRLLERGTYVPLLLELRPQPIVPNHPGDYFTEEQVRTWGVASSGGRPEDPGTAYYRSFETPVSTDAHLYEFVVPMQSPASDDPVTLDKHATRLSASSLPTAVAVSTLDVCGPAMDRDGSDAYDHWCLTHFLLDGHHKVHAAADRGLPLQLLSLLSVEAGLSSPEQVHRVAIRRR